ncbi:unnamed protein product [Durusdinium trenchii]|uniref:Uncharacterized protein n=1 Tax=Durusdinium trenchii TaxID=1381693 RepID=A0ABP0QR75_9DINO
MLQFLQEHTHIKDCTKALSEWYGAYKEKHDIEKHTRRIEKAVEMFYSTAAPNGRCKDVACEVYQTAARLLQADVLLEDVEAGVSCDPMVQEQVQEMMHLIHATLEASQPEAPIPLILETLIQSSAPKPDSPLEIKQDKMDGRAIARHWKYMEEAVMTGKELRRKVRGLLEGGFPIDDGPYGYSAFWLAAAYGKLEAAQLLFEWGANIHLRGSKEKLLPVEVASYMGHNDVVKWLLLETGAFPGKALHFAAKSGNVGIIEWALNTKALHSFINAPACGWTPLTVAIVHHRPAVSRLLASACSREELEKPLPERVCELCGVALGSTVLHLIAAHGGCYEHLVDLLLRTSPDLKEKRDQLDQTPFDVAIPKLKPRLNDAFLGCLTSIRQSLLSTPGRIPLKQLQRHVAAKPFSAETTDLDWQEVATILHRSNEVCSDPARELKKDAAFPHLKHVEKELMIDTGVTAWFQDCMSEGAPTAEGLVSQAQKAETTIRKVLQGNLEDELEPVDVQQGGKLEFSFKGSSNIAHLGFASFLLHDESLLRKVSAEELVATMDILTVVLDLENCSAVKDMLTKLQDCEGITLLAARNHFYVPNPLGVREVICLLEVSCGVPGETHKCIATLRCRCFTKKVLSRVESAKLELRTRLENMTKGHSDAQEFLLKQLGVTVATPGQDLLRSSKGDLEGKVSSLHDRDSAGWSAFLLAAQLNDTAAVEWMLEKDSSIALRRNEAGQTAMLWATFWKSTEMLEIFKRYFPLQLTHADMEGLARLKEVQERARQKDDLVTLSLLQSDSSDFEVGNETLTDQANKEQNTGTSFAGRMGDGMTPSIIRAKVFASRDLVLGFCLEFSGNHKKEYARDVPSTLHGHPQGQWKTLSLKSRQIVKIRSWDSSNPWALCARLEITVASGGVPEVFSFPNQGGQDPDFVFPEMGHLQDSQVVDLHFDGRGSCIDATVAPSQLTLKGSSLCAFSSETSLGHDKCGLEQFLLDILLPHWENEWKKMWPKPAQKDLLEWSDGNSMKGLVEAAKFFVLKAIAEGASATPQIIFALHVHTLSSRIPRDCQQALSSNDPRSHQLWAPYAHHISSALKACPLYSGYVFRTVTFQCDGENACVAKYLEDYGIHVGSEILWPGFPSGTSSSQVARNLLLGHGIEGRPRNIAGIIFKILEARAVSAAPFSKSPEDAEVIFAATSKFRVKGFYQLTDFILEDGASPSALKEWKVSLDVIKQPQLELEAAGKERDLVVLLQQLPPEAPPVSSFVGRLRVRPTQQRGLRLSTLQEMCDDLIEMRVDSGTRGKSCWNMYEVVEHIVKKKTEKKQMSYAELFEENKIDYFVTH